MSPCPAGTFPYAVQAGDTYWLLAQRFNTTIEAIMAANPGVDPNNLQIGQVICIPRFGPPPPRPCPPGLKPYTIQPGDTLWEIARHYGTTVENILSYNPGLDPNYLRVGQIICIP
ncbi:MAG: LysM peptidoglycan-binding domain-containing protein [Moorella sp. (in: Bacteria)]|nr:LysM peptidoglycan-binding domain-containing protein [Moorella sp. (in: firmicutes)]